MASRLISRAGARFQWWENRSSWPGYIYNCWRLTKPRLVAVIVFTAVVGMLLASPGRPRLGLVLLAAAGIWLAASSAATMNHVFDRRLDTVMPPTRQRLLPSGQMTERVALVFAATLGAASILILALFVNWLTALLTFAASMGYSVLYTTWLKQATPQSIAIGGAAGAAPPVLGWAAVTNSVTANALLLSLIIFTWTPPHFWALAIARRAEYSNAGIPMLPVTHGVGFTCIYIVLYTILLILVTMLPYLTGMSGAFYVLGAIALNVAFAQKIVVLNELQSADAAMYAYCHSINYLVLLFMFLLADRYCRMS